MRQTNRLLKNALKIWGFPLVSTQFFGRPRRQQVFHRNTATRAHRLRAGWHHFRVTPWTFTDPRGSSDLPYKMPHGCLSHLYFGLFPAPRMPVSVTVTTRIILFLGSGIPIKTFICHWHPGRGDNPALTCEAIFGTVFCNTLR